MRKQYDTMEEEINKLKEGKLWRVTNIFKMKDIVVGSKKRPQEAHAVMDVETKNLVVATQEIEKVTLNHVMNTFKRGAPHKDVELIIKMVNKAHNNRMVKEDEEEDIEITMEDFDELIKKLEKKNKRSYDFLLKTGSCFKRVVFQLCRRLITAETFPERFCDTQLNQL